MWALRGHGEKTAIYEPGQGFSPNRVSRCLDRGPPASRNVSDTCLLVKTPRLWIFAIAAQTGRILSPEMRMLKF